jgi:hypothetical protein
VAGAARSFMLPVAFSLSSLGKNANSFQMQMLHAA